MVKERLVAYLINILTISFSKTRIYCGGKMKGIILAGGSGTRLYPAALAVSKQMLPIYDKPMVYYPLSIIMLAGVVEILIISTPRDLPVYKALLGDGSQLGLSISYAIQEQPKGIAEAFIIGEQFIGDDKVMLVLGDNIFYSSCLSKILAKSALLVEGALIFGYKVPNPQDYGIVEFDKNLNVISLEEKPLIPKSNYAIPGLYFYDNDVVTIAKDVKPSARGEVEITSVNEEYLKRKKLRVELFDDGFMWLDTGTFDSLLDGSNFVASFQKKEGKYIACIEEIAYKRNYISKEQLVKLAEPMLKNDYGKYLMKVAQKI